MTRQRINRIIKAALLAVGALQSVAMASDSAAPGTSAGLMMWSFGYHDTDVSVAIWYPSSAPARAIPAGPFTLHAASNGDWFPASAPEGRYPLIILSHGTGGSSIAHHRIAESLAQAGYLIAAIEHPGDNYQDRSLVANAQYFDERPRQLNALLSALASDPVLSARIDPTRVGAIGHSAGGYSVAALLGATPDRQALRAHCAEQNDDPACGYADPTIAVVSQTDTPFQLPAQTDTQSNINNLQPAFAIRSAALLAPLGSVVSESSRISAEIDVLIMDAELDAILPAHYHADRIQRSAPHARRSTAMGAGHFSFISPVVTAWRESLGEVAQDPSGFDRDQFNTRVSQSLQAWFDATLNHNAHR